MGTAKYWPCDEIVRNNSGDTSGVQDSWAASYQEANPGADSTISTDHSPISGSCLKIICTKGQTYNDVHRTELRSHYDNVYEGTVGFRIFFPLDYADDPETEILHQLHELGGSPAISFQSRDGELFFESKYGSFSSNSYVEHTLGPIVKGQWIDIIYKYKIAQSGQGYLKIWRNGIQLIDYSGTIGYSDSAEPPYKKFGVYKWRWNSPGDVSTTTQRTVYYDQIRYASGDMDITLVDPSILIVHISNNGNDSNNGSTEALAIQTIAKLNTIAAAGSGLDPGYQVLLEKASEWKENIYLPTQNDGTSTDPIVITNYGTGDDPIISGFRSVGTWVTSTKGANIWEVNNASFPTEITGLVWDGVLRDRGKLPKVGVATYQSFSGTTSITSDEIIPDVDFSGGEVYAVIEKTDWIHDRVKVTGKTGNTITYTGGSSYPGKENNFFFIDNAIEALTAQGDWMYSDSEKKMYIYSTVDPNALGVRYVSDQYNIHLDGAIYNTIDGLHFEGSWDTAVRLHVSHNAQVLNSTFKNISGMAARALTATNIHVEGNLFEDCLEGGLHLINASDGAVITRNTFLNIAMRLGYSGNGDGKGMGIFNSSGSGTTSLNRYENIGYIAIRFHGSDTIVEKNFIDGFCLLKHDGGATYCYGGTSGSSTFINQIVRNNIVKNGGSNPLHSVYGHYTDDNSQNIIYVDNYVDGIPAAAFYIHNSHEISIQDCISSNYGIGVQFGQNGSNELVRNNQVDGSIFLATSKNSVTYQLRSESDDLDLFAAFDNNTFIFLQGGEFVVSTRHMVGSKLFFNNYTWSQWQTLGNDLNSAIINLDVPEYTIISEGANRFDFAASNITSSFHSGGTAVVTKNPTGYTNTYMVEATVPSATTTRIEFAYPSLGAVESNKKYIVRFKAMAPSGHQSLIVYVRETGTPYRRSSKEIATYTDDQFKDFEFLLQELQDFAQVSVLIECQANQGALYVSDFEFLEVEAEITNLEEHVKILYNDTELPTDPILVGSWKKVDDTPVVGSYPLESFESVLLLKVNDVPEAYTVTATAGIGGTVTGGGGYSDGETAELEAIPDPGFTFIQWSDDETINPYIFVVTGDVSLEAIFEEDEPTPVPDTITVRGRFVIV